MIRHYTIGIAGHIDHGKTSLTMALTQIDTDRLPEEKKRGISIEPGYALFNLPSGKRASIIDVPGHEKFIRQMIAGCSQIDLCLLVIDVKEGIMPQTVEHANIIRLLNIGNMIVVLTKTDLVSREHLTSRLAEIEIWFTATGISNVSNKIISVNNRTGEGIQQLISGIETMLKDLPLVKGSAPFRLPIDRSFSLHGIGTVVTGTLNDGVVQTGDWLMLMPGDQKVRVRQIHVHHQKVEKATGGQRVAINLTNLSNGTVIRRGDCLVAPGAYELTACVDLKIEVLDKCGPLLRKRERIRFHTGTAEAIGVLKFYDNEECQEDHKCFAQIRLETPLLCSKGDRFIIRRLTPSVTLAGGEIVSAFGDRKSKHSYYFENEHSDYDSGLLYDISAFLKRNSSLTIRDLSVFLSLTVSDLEGRLKSLIKTEQIVVLDEGKNKRDKHLLLMETWQKWRKILTDRIANFHSQYSLKPGIRIAELKQGFPYEVSDSLFNVVLNKIINDESAVLNGPYIALPDFRPYLPEQSRMLFISVLSTIESNGMKLSEWNLLKRDFGLVESTAYDFYNYMITKKMIKEVSATHIVALTVWEEIVQAFSNLFIKNQLFTLSDAKKCLPELSRSHLIYILEFMDKLGLTSRVENMRIWLGNSK